MWNAPHIPLCVNAALPLSGESGSLVMALTLYSTACLTPCSLSVPKCRYNVTGGLPASTAGGFLLLHLVNSCSYTWGASCSCSWGLPAPTPGGFLHLLLVASASIVIASLPWWLVTVSQNKPFIPKVSFVQILTFLLRLFIHVHVCTHMPRHMCVSQRTMHRSCFCPPTTCELRREHRCLWRSCIPTGRKQLRHTERICQDHRKGWASKMFLSKGMRNLSLPEFLTWQMQSPPFNYGNIQTHRCAGPS